jgi:hypothetical protein
MSHFRSDVSEGRKYTAPNYHKMHSMTSDRPNRENNFGQFSGVSGGRHPHASQLKSPSSFLDVDVADQVLTSPRNAP